MDASVQLGPLGLLPRHHESLSVEVLDKLRKLSDLDMRPEKQSLFRHQPDLYVFIEVIERELKRLFIASGAGSSAEIRLGAPVARR